MQTTIPQWAIENLHSKGLGFEVKGVHEAIWNKFEAEFCSKVFSVSELPNYMPTYIDHLLDSGWIDQVRIELQQHIQRKEPRTPMLSPIELLDRKIDNFYKSQSTQGRLVEFKVVAQCPYCKAELSLTRFDLNRGLSDCSSCQRVFQI